MICSICKKIIIKEKDSITAGYGTNRQGQKMCYFCCAENDKERMRNCGQITLYLTRVDTIPRITNWPASLIFDKITISRGRHNWGLIRYDCWFIFEDYYWHGIRYGDNTELVHCKRTKKAV